jgi:hypothetical protein
MFHKRRYVPVHPEKYKGDPTNIIMRSSWETKFAIWCDHNPSVIRWSSEETVIPYRCPIRNTIHRYFVDFKINVKTKTGETKVYLVEIKPFKQTQPPDYPGKQTKRYIQESTTFMVNQAKWKAATSWAKDRNWDFIVLTENELGIGKHK